MGRFALGRDYGLHVAPVRAEAPLQRDCREDEQPVRAALLRVRMNVRRRRAVQRSIVLCCVVLWSGRAWKRVWSRSFEALAREGASHNHADRVAALDHQDGERLHHPAPPKKATRTLRTKAAHLRLPHAANSTSAWLPYTQSASASPPHCRI